MVEQIRGGAALFSEGKYLRLGIASALLLATSCTQKSGPDPEGERNRAFAASMTNVALVGYSTSLRREGLSKGERYEIDKVSYISGDMWLFQTRLKYEEHDIPVPMPLTIKWAGDTPVITMTDLSIPGVGTYTARVVLYREQYAGTWSGQRGGGGQVFGKIVKR